MRIIIELDERAATVRGEPEAPGTGAVAAEAAGAAPVPEAGVLPMPPDVPLAMPAVQPTSVGAVQSLDAGSAPGRAPGGEERGIAPVGAVPPDSTTMTTAENAGAPAIGEVSASASQDVPGERESEGPAIIGEGLDAGGPPKFHDAG